MSTERISQKNITQPTLSQMKKLSRDNLKNANKLMQSFELYLAKAKTVNERFNNFLPPYPLYRFNNNDEDIEQDSINQDWAMMQAIEKNVKVVQLLMKSNKEMCEILSESKVDKMLLPQQSSDKSKHFPSILTCLEIKQQSNHGDQHQPVSKMNPSEEQIAENRKKGWNSEIFLISKENKHHGQEIENDGKNWKDYFNTENDSNAKKDGQSNGLIKLQTHNSIKFIKTKMIDIAQSNKNSSMNKWVSIRYEVKKLQMKLNKAKEQLKIHQKSKVFHYFKRVLFRTSALILGPFTDCITKCIYPDKLEYPMNSFLHHFLSQSFQNLFILADLTFMIGLTFVLAAIDLYDLKNRQVKESSKRFYEILKKTQLQENFKDFTLEKFQDLLYHEYLIMEVLKKLEYESNFCQIEFERKLTDKEREQLLNISNYEFTNQILLSEKCSLHELNKMKNGQQRTYTGLTVLKYILYQQVRKTTWVFQAIQILGFIILVFFDVITLKIPYFMTTDESKVLQLVSLGPWLYGYINQWYWFEIVFKTGQRFVVKILMLQKLAVLVNFKSNSPSDPNEQETSLPRINFLDMNTPRTIQKLQKILCYIWEAESTILVSIMIFFSLFSVGIYIFEKEEAPVYVIFMIAWFTTIIYIGLFLFAYFNFGIQNQRKQFQAIKMRIIKLSWKLPIYFSNREITPQLPHEQKLINYCTNQLLPISELNKSQSRKEWNQAIIDTIKDRIESTDQIIEEIEIDADQHTLKLFGIPITFDLIKQVSVLAGTYLMDQLQPKVVQCAWESNQQLSTDTDDIKQDGE